MIHVQDVRDLTVRRMIPSMMIGDAIYRVDEAGWGYRLEYIELDLMSMGIKYVMFRFDVPIRKYDIRGREALKTAHECIYHELLRCGFTGRNSRLIVGGAVTKPSASFSRVPRFEKVS